MSDTSARVVVIGAGAAGLSAAFTAAWHGAHVQLLDPLGPGGQLQNAGPIETLPGLDTVTGPDLVERMVNRFDGLTVDTLFAGAVGVTLTDGALSVATDDGSTLTADVVIVATGSRPRPLGVPGETEFEHRGVSHCAACDGPLYRGRNVVVAGGGDGAADAALALAAAGANVTLVHRGSELVAAAALRRHVEQSERIERVANAEVTEIVGADVVTEVVLRSIDGSARTLAVSGVFTAAGVIVDGPELAPALARADDGRIIVDEHLATTMPGVFAAGSVRQGTSDQLGGVIGDGTNAAVNALRWWSGELELALPVTGPTASDVRASAGDDSGVFGSYTEFYAAQSDTVGSDGLPLVPPTRARIERLLAAARVDGGERLTAGTTAADLIACAVGAGCGPEHAALVLAGARSLLFDLDTNRDLLPESVLAVVVNGPARLTADLNCSDGLLGPGWRANATIGRALRLFAGGPLGVPSSCGFGDPGQYTFCFGEDEEKSVWTPLHVERGFTPAASAVTVFPAPVYRQVMDRAHTDSAGIVDFLALFLRGRAAGSRLFGDAPLALMLIIGQEHRRYLAPDYTKAQLRETLFERATADIGTPFGPISIASPDDIAIVAAGGVAFPTTWVLTRPAGPSTTVAVDPTAAAPSAARGAA